MTSNEYETTEQPQTPGPTEVYPTSYPDSTFQSSPYQYTPANNSGTRNNWQGITALVASLASIPVMFVIGMFTLPLLICGIVFGHLGLSSVKKGTANNKGLALGGLITSYALLGIGVLMVVGVFLLLLAVGTA